MTPDILEFNKQGRYLRYYYTEHSHLAYQVVFDDIAQRLDDEVLVKVRLNELHKNVAFEIGLVGHVFVKSPEI